MKPLSTTVDESAHILCGVSENTNVREETEESDEEREDRNCEMDNVDLLDPRGKDSQLESFFDIHLRAGSHLCNNHKHLVSERSQVEDSKGSVALFKHDRSFCRIHERLTKLLREYQHLRRVHHRLDLL